MKPTEWTLYDWVKNPPEVYRKMRQAGPIHWSDDYHGWLVIDYDLARELLKDSRLSSDTTEALKDTTFPKRSREKVTPLLELYRSWLIFSDPPYHSALRKILNPFFSQSALAERAPKIKQHVHELLSECHGEWDFMKMFASPLPLRIMADLMELPYEAIDQCLDWNAKLAYFIETTIRSPGVCDDALEALKNQKEYFTNVIGQATSGGFVENLYRSVSEDDLFDKNYYWQLLSMILATGTETTHNLLGSGIFALLSHPEQYQLLQENPELIDSAIDESLRFYSPIQSVFRVAMDDMPLQNITIKKGHYVRIILGAINRDPNHFENSDEFDITRSPNKHLSFGAGIHFCLGRMLARLVAQIAFPIILKTFPNLQLVTKEPEWIGGTTFRGLKAFLVR